MIPKIIHFCWLSNDPYPELVRLCLDSWEKMLPDYQIKKWDATNFDINFVRFVKEAYEMKKWAFAADYIRLYALYHHGGIYLDSDVFVKKNFDPLLNNVFFSSVEYSEYMIKKYSSNNLIDSQGNVIDKNIVRIPGIAVQAAIMGAVKGNEYIYDCLQYYKNKPFILENGDLDNKNLSPDVMAFIARNYGFKYIDKEQLLKDRLMFYPSVYFAGYPELERKNTYAIHYCSGSWRTKSFMIRFKDDIKSLLFIVKKKLLNTSKN